MPTTITIARVSGIPIRIHLNWFITAALVTWSLSVGYFPLEYPHWSRATYWLVGSLTSVLFFLSVLLHELGHARVAIADDVPVQSITLFLFGGVAHISHEPETPGSEFCIVAAGPITSLLLAGLFFLLGRSAFLAEELKAVAVYLARINVILAIFNLIPGFPLDGGRLLRATLWKLIDNFHRATRWATNTGIAIAALFIVAGLAFIFNGNWIGGLWIIFIGGYLGMVAHGSAQSAHEDQIAFLAEQEEEVGIEFVEEKRLLTRENTHSEKTLPRVRLPHIPPLEGSGSLSYVPIPVDEPKEK